ncbi:hypothetical protein SRABI96_03400 [Peribacillus sp. Bi96]|nr:hypothetical protein SRABI96_03400 [Peribacillus sp. Bi96]
MGYPEKNKELHWFLTIVPVSGMFTLLCLNTFENSLI